MLFVGILFPTRDQQAPLTMNCLLIFTLASSVLLVQGVPQKSTKCFHLFQAISAFLLYDANERGGETAKMFNELTGVDFRDTNQIWKYACSLEKIKTVEEFSHMVHLPYNQLSAMYKDYVAGIRKTGGVEAVLNHLQMRVRIISLALQNNLTAVNFLELPLTADRDALLNFFEALTSEFGSNFLDWVYYGGEFRDMTERFVLKHPEELVDALRGSSSIKEVTQKMNFDQFRTRAMLKHLTENVHEKPGSYSSYMELVKVLREESGLYELRD